MTIFVFQTQLGRVFPGGSPQFNMASAVFVGVLIILLVRYGFRVSCWCVMGLGFSIPKRILSALLRGTLKTRGLSTAELVWGILEHVCNVLGCGDEGVSPLFTLESARLAPSVKRPSLTGS